MHYTQRKHNLKRVKRNHFEEIFFRYLMIIQRFKFSHTNVENLHTQDIRTSRIIVKNVDRFKDMFLFTSVPMSNLCWESCSCCRRTGLHFHRLASTQTEQDEVLRLLLRVLQWVWVLVSHPLKVWCQVAYPIRAENKSQLLFLLLSDFGEILRHLNIQSDFNQIPINQIIIFSNNICNVLLTRLLILLLIDRKKN